MPSRMPTKISYPVFLFGGVLLPGGSSRRGRVEVPLVLTRALCDVARHRRLGCRWWWGQGWVGGVGCGAADTEDANVASCDAR
jgi:hypothetical protein